MATLEELEARLQRLTDIKEIERLQKIYGYYCDYFEFDKVVDLFSDNTESVEVADHGVYKGKECVRRFYIDLIQGGEGKEPRFGLLSINFQLQGVITVDPGGKSARGR